jgi:hypothetical protein
LILRNQTVERETGKLTKASDDTAEQKKDLEMEITRLESENLEERTQQKKEEDRKKEEAATVVKAGRNRKRAEKEAEEETKRVAKAERDRKGAEKVAGEEAQRAAKAAVRDAKWSAEDDETIVKIIADDVPCSKIASILGNGRSEYDIRNRWNRYLKESFGTIKPQGKTGQRSRITWAADIDEAIVSMKEGGSTFEKIASKLGNGLKKSDIKNRWNRHLKTT